MIIDARSLPAGQQITTDVCIVGAGVAGLTLAQELLDQPLQVCVLESGGFHRDKTTQALAEGENVGLPCKSLDRVRLREVGGSSHAWGHSLGWRRRGYGARMRPLDAVDFEKRDWIPHSGWPFAKSHLDPYYTRAESVFDLGPQGSGTEEWESLGNERGFRFREDEIRTVIYKIGPRDPFTTRYPRQLARARNASLVIYANVLEIETDETGQSVTSLRVACLNGKEFRVSARVFVLAAGGIEVPRLLLLSNRRQPAGLGNQHDLVGRFFMEHPHFTLGRFLPAHRGAVRSAGLYRTHTAGGKRILGNLALAEEVIRREPLLNLSIGLAPDIPRLPPPRSVEGINAFTALRSTLYGGRIPRDLGAHLGQIARDAPVITGHALRRAWLRMSSLVTRPAVYRLGHMTEQSPNPHSRVMLSSKRDRFGQPRVQLNWQLQDLDIRSVLRAHEILHANLVRSELGGLETEKYDEVPEIRILEGNHHMGTTRMHSDPKQGVVNEHSRVHGISNLFIASSSVFPTSGYANPTFTIGALAIRLADHLKGLLSTGNGGKQPSFAVPLTAPHPISRLPPHSQDRTLAQTEQTGGEGCGRPADGRPRSQGEASGT